MIIWTYCQPSLHDKYPREGIYSSPDISGLSATLPFLTERFLQTIIIWCQWKDHQKVSIYFFHILISLRIKIAIDVLYLGPPSMLVFGSHWWAFHLQKTDLFCQFLMGKYFVKELEQKIRQERKKRTRNQQGKKGHINAVEVSLMRPYLKTMV